MSLAYEKVAVTVEITQRVDCLHGARTLTQHGPALCGYKLVFTQTLYLYLYPRLECGCACYYRNYTKVFNLYHVLPQLFYKPQICIPLTQH